MAGDADLSDSFTKQLAGMLVCLTCGPLDRFCIGKIHKSRTKHEMRPLSEEERAEEISWYKAIKEDGEDARMKKLEERRRKARAARNGEDGKMHDGLEPGNDEYRFDFGKHKGLTLTRVWREHKDYLPYLLNQSSDGHGFLDTKIMLRRAMESAGILKDAQARALEMRTAKAQQLVQNAHKGPLVALHPEVLQLREMQLEDARAVLLAGECDTVCTTPPVHARPRGRRPRLGRVPVLQLAGG